MVKKRVADLTDAQPVEVKVNPLVSPEDRRLGRIVGALRSGIVIARVMGLGDLRQSDRCGACRYQSIQRALHRH